MAGGTVVFTQDSPSPGSLVRRIVATCTADAADASFSQVIPKFEGRLLAIKTTPDGTTPPTDLYDITLVDDAGADRLNGAGADQSDTNVSRTLVTGEQAVVGKWEELTLTWANNAVNSAVAVVELVYGMQRS